MFCQIQHIQWVWDFQISMDVIYPVPLFKVSSKFKSGDFACVCHDQRSTFCWNSRFWSSSVSLTSAEGTLLGYLWANVKNQRTVSTHWIITCQIWQCECWSIQVYWRVWVRVSVPRQNTLEAEQGDMEIVDLLMDRAFWLHSAPRMAEKPFETSGTRGMKRESGVG